MEFIEHCIAKLELRVKQKNLRFYFLIEKLYKIKKIVERKR